MLHDQKILKHYGEDKFSINSSTVFLGNEQSNSNIWISIIYLFVHFSKPIYEKIDFKSR